MIKEINLNPLQKVVISEEDVIIKIDNLSEDKHKKIEIIIK
jgi:hypothetical protein